MNAVPCPTCKRFCQRTGPGEWACVTCKYTFRLRPIPPQALKGGVTTTR